MQTQPIRATAPKARTRKEIFAVDVSTANISESGRRAASLVRLADPCRCRWDFGYLCIHIVSE